VYVYNITESFKKINFIGRRIIFTTGKEEFHNIELHKVIKDYPEE
jgi:hypothetical protein